MITVSTSPPFTCRINWSSVSLAVFSWPRVCPLARSPRAVVRSRAGVTVRAMSSPSWSFETDEDIFDFGVQLECVHAQLAADATALVAAERRLLVDAPAAVDAQDSGAHAACHPQRAADVAGPDRAGKAVGRVVDQP